MKRRGRLLSVVKVYRLKQEANVRLAKYWDVYLKQSRLPPPQEELEEKLPDPFANVTVRKKKKAEEKREEAEEEPLDVRNVTMRRRKKKEEGPTMEEILLYIKRKTKDNKYQLNLLNKDLGFLEGVRVHRRMGDPAALADVCVAERIRQIRDLGFKMKAPADEEND